MPGYTVKGLDNLLDKKLEKIKSISQELNRIEESVGIIDQELDEKFKRYVEDYSNILQARMELYIQERRKNNL